MKSVKVLFFVLLCALTHTGYSQHWIFLNDEDTMDDAGNPDVLSFYPADSIIYVGGIYNYAGGLLLRDIGIWDGSEWQPMSYGISNSGGIWAITKYKEKIYVGGQFYAAYDSTNNEIGHTVAIARWNGVCWEALPNSYGDLYGSMSNFIIYNDTLIIGDNLPGTPSRVCGYDGDIDDYVHMGSLPSGVLALELYHNEIYAGGTWLTLKKYVGGSGLAAWQDVGGHLNYYIQDMFVDTFNDFLYVGGGFFVVDDTILTDNVAIWNGHYWEGIGGYGGISDVMTLAVYNGDLYTGRAADSAGGVYTKRLARWDGQNWSMVGGGVNGVSTLEVINNELYVGGGFDTVNGERHKSFAIWVDTTPNCRYLKPRVFTVNNEDTFYLSSGTVDIQFYNNNTYADNWLWSFGDGYSVTEQNPSHTFIDTGTYNVCVTVTHDSCVKTACKTITILNQTATATMAIKPAEMKIYPNPTDGNFFVDIALPPSNEQAEIKIFGQKGDLKARYPLQQGKNHIEIPSSKWKAGNYLVSLIVGGKLVKSKYLTVTK